MKHQYFIPPKCYYDSENHIVQEIISILNSNQRKEFTKDFKSNNTDSSHRISEYKSFDCSIMDIADDISNSIHDLEDVIYLNQIHKNKFEDEINSLELSRDDHKYYNKILNARINFNLKKLIGNLFIKEQNKQAIGDLVYLCVNSCEIAPIEIFSNDDDIFKYNVKLKNPCDKLVIFLKNYILKNVIKSPNVQTIVHGGMMVIMKLFDAYETNPEALLSPEWYKIYKNNDENDKKRIICNFIAGMTDAYAYRIYSRLYGHNNSNMFDKI